MMVDEPRWRRCAYIAVEDAASRTPIVRTLADAGWEVAESSTGVRVLQDLCDVIASDGQRIALGLIVVEHRLRGCTGVTIARGLRELGVRVPIVLIARPEDQLGLQDDSIMIVAPERATTVICRIASPRSRTGSGPVP
jgi:hypothetical protein